MRQRSIQTNMSTTYIFLIGINTVWAQCSLLKALVCWKHCWLYPHHTLLGHNDKEAAYLHLLIIIKDNKFHTKLYDKRDSFYYTIISYPHPIASNIPAKPAYGVYASCIISFGRASDHCNDFSRRQVSSCDSLLRQGRARGLAQW